MEMYQTLFFWHQYSCSWLNVWFLQTAHQTLSRRNNSVWVVLHNRCWIHKLVAVKPSSKSLPPQTFPMNVNEKVLWSGSCKNAPGCRGRLWDGRQNVFSGCTEYHYSPQNHRYNCGFSLSCGSYSGTHSHASIYLSMVNNAVNASEQD